MVAEDMPILGEPFPVEFANTRYPLPEGPFDYLDYLGDRADVGTWFAASPTAGAFACPRRPTDSWHRQLTALRDATRSILDALVAGTRPPQADLDAVARTAAAATRRRTIEWAGRPLASVTYDGAAGDRALAAMADAVIDFVTGDQAELIRTCESEDCWMLFVRHHHRRRWCHDGCSHRNRQARYYRRRTGAEES